MNETEILNRLETIFRKNFPDADFEFSKDLDGTKIGDWDSLSHIHLISDIRETFQLKFTAKEMRSLNDVASMLSLIHSKL